MSKVRPIKKSQYSWERPERSRKRRGKPFYLRWWFYAPFALLALGLIAGWVGWVIFSAPFQRQADSYDLTQMQKWEAASIIYDRNGVELGKIFIENRHPVALSEISPMMVKAVIAAEDNKFYSHSGVDYMGILRAVITNYRHGHISQGASTVTQQVARNSFDLHQRTYKRKLVEMFLALRIEKNFNKNQIMEMYLNRVYFGSGLYGVESAARGYFGHSAKELDVGQCAMLASLLKSPQALSPWNNKEGATQSRDFVLRRMKELGFISSADYEEDVATPLYVMKRTNPLKTSYAIDAIRQQTVAALGFDRAMNGGFHIESTIDLKMQKAAEQSMRDVLAKVEASSGYSHPTYEAYRAFTKSIEDQINQGNMTLKMPEPKYLQGAVVALDNRTGGVLVMVGGRDFKHSEYNRVTMSRRPPGTAFVPLVFAAAYDRGVFPGQVVDDAALDNHLVMVGGESGILGEWGVERADNRYEGPISTHQALVEGKNAATVRLGLQIGIDQVKKVASAAGINSPLKNYANTFLGSSEVTLQELTLAYTMFPDGGSRPKEPYMISKITDAAGNIIYQKSPETVKAISPEAAYQVHAGLADALRYGTGSIAYTQYGLSNMPAGGKTGTAYNFTDTYFVGYDSSVTCGVWVGFDRPTRIFEGAFGRDLALPIWAHTMNVAAIDLPTSDFQRPDTLKPVEICSVSGLLATPLCRTTETDPVTGQAIEHSTTYTEWATAAEMPTIRCDIHGGGIRDYSKIYNQEQWPRAQAAVDLAMVRPVAVTSPTLIGLGDVYNSVRPDAQKFQDSIPVAKAIPVEKPSSVPGTTPDGSAPPAAAPDAIPGGPSDAPPAADAAPKPAGAEPEVRKAEAVKPLDSPLDTPAIQAATPPPIKF